MAKPKQSAHDYASLNDELAGILARLESGEVDIDTAVELYGRGLEIVGNLEQHLTQAEHRIRVLRDAAGIAKSSGGT